MARAFRRSSYRPVARGGQGNRGDALRKAGENPERWLVAASHRYSRTAEKIAAGSTIFLSERNAGKRNVARVQTLPAPGLDYFYGLRFDIDTDIERSDANNFLCESFFPRAICTGCTNVSENRYQTILFNIETRETSEEIDMSLNQIFPILNLFYIIYFI